VNQLIGNVEIASFVMGVCVWDPKPHGQLVMDRRSKRLCRQSDQMPFLTFVIRVDEEVFNLKPTLADRRTTPRNTNI